MSASSIAPPGSPDSSPELQRKQERRIAARYRGRLEWRLVVEAIWSVGGWVAVIALVLNGTLSLAAGFLLNLFFAQACYMPMHEATHGNVNGGRRGLTWLNDWVGRLTAIPLCSSYRGHEYDHMRHHAHTNDPERDPDAWTAGPLATLPKRVFISLGLRMLLPIAPLIPGLRHVLPESVVDRIGSYRGTDEAIRLSRQNQALQYGVLAASAAAGYFREAFLLWFLPGLLATLWLYFIFAWLPHFPHSETGRYTNTRVTLFPGSHWLARGHDRHVLHHMFPRVAHYRLKPLFAELRPALEANGTRIQGSLAGAQAEAVDLG